MSTPIPARLRIGALLRRSCLCALVPALALGCTNTTSSSTAPTVTSFSPTTNSGGTGTLITVYGTDFSTATAVTICGVTVSSGATGSAVISDTELTFDLPSVTTTGPITVTGSGGTGTSSQDFIVIPSVSTFPAARPGANAVITGNGLLGVSAVTFTNPSTNATTSATIVSATATTLTVTIPSTLVGGTTYDYTLSNTYGVSYATGSYTPAS